MLIADGKIPESDSLNGSIVEAYENPARIAIICPPNINDSTTKAATRLMLIPVNKSARSCIKRSSLGLPEGNALGDAVLMTIASEMATRILAAGGRFL